MSDSQLFESKEVQSVLNSDVAINALLTKLKKSILVSEEFAKFIKRKFTTEEIYTEELAKHYKHFYNNDSISLTANSSSLHRNMVKVIEFDGHFAVSRQNYIRSLEKMYDELSALLLTMTKIRKSVKEKSRHLEKNLADSIHLAEKTKNKYFSLCQDYDKLRMYDPTKTILTLRGSKTLREQEDDISRKIDIANLDYKQKVEIATSLRDTFVTVERPNIVSNLIDLILELETAMAIQLQKFAISTESLIFNDGQIISPLDQKTHSSMRKIIGTTANNEDLKNYLKRVASSQSNYVNKNLVPVTYTQHASMLKKSRSRSSSAPKAPPTFAVDPSRNSIPKNLLSQTASPFDKSLPVTKSATTPNLNRPGKKLPKLKSEKKLHKPVRRPLPLDKKSKSVNKEISKLRKDEKSTKTIQSTKAKPLVENTSASSSSTSSSETSTSSGSSSSSESTESSTSEESSGISQNSVDPEKLKNEKKSKSHKRKESSSSQRLSNNELQNNGGSFKTLDPSPSANRVASASKVLALATKESERPHSTIQTDPGLPPGVEKNLKVFGTPLQTLFAYEQDMVPTIVRQCIHVVDRYGLNLEGIYRKGPPKADLDNLITQINESPDQITTLIPPPEHTDNDIYMIGFLLKAFFQSLDDTLVPASSAPELQICLSVEDPITKKNYMHGLIYKFADAQYWTLRSVIFHLRRVMANEQQNKMNLRAIAIVWGPIILPLNETDVNDVDYQIQILETLFNVADQAFEPE